MGEVLYNDGMIAVVEYDDTQGSDVDARLIKRLLEVSEDNLSNHLPTLLGYHLAKVGFSMTLDSEEWRRAAISQADKGQLEELGFVVHEAWLQYSRDPETRTKLVLNNHNRLAISVPRAEKRVIEYSDFVQYLVKLYLLSEGVEEHSGLIQDVVLGRSGVRFKAVLPIRFWYGIFELQLIVPVRFSTEAIEQNVKLSDRNFEVLASIEYEKMSRFPSSLSWSEIPFPEDETEIKRVLASFLLSTLIDCMSAVPYTTDARTLKLKRTDNQTIASCIADCVIDGKLVVCPNCKKPVLKLRPSSKPFCKSSHQVRYHEKARKMRKKGATVDEVAEAFPYIQRETIANW